MGQKPSRTADEDPLGDAGSSSYFNGIHQFLLGCATPCSDAATESTGSLARVVQHCCISSEREGVLELVEQHRVIGDAARVIEEDAWVAWTSPRSLDTGAGYRSKLLVRPERDRRFEELYSLEKQVGEGSFGNVYKAKAKNEKGAESAVAVKVFSLASPIASPEAKVESEEAKRKLASFFGECAMLAHLDHPHIVRMHESFQSTCELHLVLEMCHGGELYALLADGLDESFGQMFFRQMLQAIGYLHARRIVHRDVKRIPQTIPSISSQSNCTSTRPENFLVSGTSERLEDVVLKLCDFGTAMVLTEQRPRSLVNIGTLSYTAPEVYQRKGADLPADIWSLGVVLYVMLTGTNPFRNGKDTTKQARIPPGMFATERPSWLKVSPAGQDVVRKLLVLPEALQHGWMVGSKPRFATPETPQTLAVTVIRVLQHMLKLQMPQRHALFACAMGATEADLPHPAAWRSLFLLLDTDHDGRLSIEECAAGLQRLTGRTEVADEDLRTAIKVGTLSGVKCNNMNNILLEASDLDSNGVLDWAEWLCIGLLTVTKLAEAGLVVEFAQRLLSRMCTAGQSDVVLGIWKTAQQLKSEADKAVRGAPLSLHDLRLVLSSCQEVLP
eukprot:symbB.v1.2.012613.t1/scaffold874.1/size155782/7